jgi:hypothetical protein
MHKLNNTLSLLGTKQSHTIKAAMQSKYKNKGLQKACNPYNT